MAGCKILVKIDAFGQNFLQLPVQLPVSKELRAVFPALPTEMMNANRYEDGTPFRACDIRGGAKYGEVQGHGQAKENGCRSAKLS